MVPILHQAIIWTIVEPLSIWPLRRNFNDIQSKYKPIFQQNIFEDVSGKTLAILFRNQWVWEKYKEAMSGIFYDMGRHMTIAFWELHAMFPSRCLLLCSLVSCEAVYITS